MKSSLISFLIAMALIASAHAVGFRVEFTNKYSPDKIKTNVQSSIQIYMNNGVTPFYDGLRYGFSMPLMIYGDADIEWIDMGGPTIIEYPDYFPFGFDTDGAFMAFGNFGLQSEWFNYVNRISIFSAESWDSNLPDTLNITLIGGVGWKRGLGELLAFELFLNTGPSEGQLCIDSIRHSIYDYDWYWYPPSGPFGGPYCITVENGPMPPVIADCPQEVVNRQWHETINLVLEIDDPDSDSITAAEANIGAAEITGFGQVTWTYNSTCDDVGVHTVEICVADETYACPGYPGFNTCQFELNIFNTPPEFVNCPDEVIPVPKSGSRIINMEVIDANVGDILHFESFGNPAVTVDANTGKVTIDGAVSGDGLFTAEITVTDCAGASASCILEYTTVSSSNEIVIACEEDVYQGHYQSVAVTKEQGNSDFYGFDFLITYDAAALSLMGVAPGELFDPDGYFKWEYFTYRFGPFGNCGNACPSGLVRTVGLAETNNGSYHPSEYFIPNGTILFNLNFLVSNDRTLECQFVPIKFYWMDCGDNTIAYHPLTDPDPLSILTAVSADVFDYIGPYYNDITDPETGYPTYTGFQGDDLCPPLSGKPEAIENIVFYNGGINIICADDIDARGDINLNGIANEIADAVVLVNYFIYGLEAFTVNTEGQIAASDVNADGRTLSVADLVYLIRVITGDALPYSKLTPYAETAEFFTGNGIIRTTRDIGAVYFEFDGNQDISLGASARDMELSSHFDGTKTRAIVYSLKMNQTCSGDLLIANVIPAAIEAVDYFGNAYQTEFGRMPNNYSLNIYPNPFNAVTTIQFELPANAPWNYRIYNITGQKVFESDGISVGGNNEIIWNAADMATGIYFGTLSFEGQKIIEKMILLK